MTHGSSRLALMGLLVIGACDKPESKDEAASKPAERDDDDDDERDAAKPIAATSPELITNEVFRPSGGHALILLPELPDGWTLVHLRRAGISGIQVFRGTPTDFTGFITLMIFPPMDPAPTKEKMLEQFQSMMGTGTPHLVAAGAPTRFEPTGLATTLAGSSETGVAEKAWMGVVVDGSAAVGIMVRCETSLFDTQLMPMKDTLLTGLRVGKAVPTLPDTAPSVKLEGVWEYLGGLDLAWMTFDPRGYAHSGSPNDPSWLDLDVSLALGRGLYRYSIEGGELVLEPFPADPDRTTRRARFERKDDALILSGWEHRRIDEAPVTLAPGSWEYYDSSSTGNAYTGSQGVAVDELTYVIAADGTYEYTGGFSFSHTEMDVGSPGAIDWTSAGYAANAPAKGKWKVEGHQLILDDGKTKAVRTIYMSKHSGKVVYIGGQKFVKMK